MKTAGDLKELVLKTEVIQPHKGMSRPPAGGGGKDQRTGSSPLQRAWPCQLSDCNPTTLL